MKKTTRKNSLRLFLSRARH